MRSYTRCAFAFAVFLSGCGAISPGGLIAVSQLDPLETAPSDLSVAVSVPAYLGLQDGDATLTLAFRPEDPTGADGVLVEVPLAITPGTAGPKPSAGRTIYVLGFAPTAAQEVAMGQERIKNLRAAGIAGQGSLSVQVQGGCLHAPLGPRLPVATWIEIQPGSGFVSLTRDVNLFQSLSAEDLAGLKAKLGPCAADP